MVDFCSTPVSANIILSVCLYSLAYHVQYSWLLDSHTVLNFLSKPSSLLHRDTYSYLLEFFNFKFFLPRISSLFNLFSIWVSHATTSPFETILQIKKHTWPLISFFWHLFDSRYQNTQKWALWRIMATWNTGTNGTESKLFSYKCL